MNSGNRKNDRQPKLATFPPPCYVSSAICNEIGTDSPPPSIPTSIPQPPPPPTCDLHLLRSAAFHFQPPFPPLSELSWLSPPPPLSSILSVALSSDRKPRSPNFAAGSGARQSSNSTLLLQNVWDRAGVAGIFLLERGLQWKSVGWTHISIWKSKQVNSE